MNNAELSIDTGVTDENLVLNTYVRSGVAGAEEQEYLALPPPPHAAKRLSCLSCGITTSGNTTFSGAISSSAV